MCLIPEAEEEPPKALPVWDEAVTRGRWLVGLLLLQSASSVVLDSYQDLLRDHLVVTLFLTMLVGAGGNAGNQSAIKVIRGLATGSITTSWASIRATLTEQVEVSLLLGGGLSAAGFARVYVTTQSLVNAAAISLSLLAIVIASVLLGSALPFVLARAGVDPANAGTSIQVLMDIIGVAITCATCQAVLVQYAGSLGG
ncbi:MgtE [Scenedesmus sp. PABB004]|nr:MgtE [Scenedesmus sp. PABB004]